MEQNSAYRKGFLPYALAAFLIGLVGGFSTVLGPAFVQDLGIAYSNSAWTSLAQAMSTAACAPILGRVGDSLGRRRTLLGGIAVFTLGNVLSAAAASLPQMLLARFIVGIGIAAMTPVIMSYIVTEFPPQQLARGFSLYMLISSASVVAGPTLGGLMIAAAGWQSMVWVCAAISALVFFACLALSGGEAARPRPVSRGAFDYPGAVLGLLFFSLALCLPSFAQNPGWRSPVFVGALMAAALSLAGLLWAERRAAQPVLPLWLLRRRVFLLSVLALFLTQGLMQANMTNLIVFVNYTRPAQSALSGYAISALYLGMALGALTLGPLADHFSQRAVLLLTLLFTGAGAALMLLFSADAPLRLLMASLGLLGLGLGGSGTLFMKIALTGIPPEAAGAGTGAYGLFRDLAAPFGVAVLVPLFTNRAAALTAAGHTAAEAAVRAIHTLALAELLSLAMAAVVVCLLPREKV